MTIYSKNSLICPIQIYDDEDADIIMMMSIQEEMKKQEHVLNFKGSIKGQIVVARDRISGAQSLYND